MTGQLDATMDFQKRVDFLPIIFTTNKMSF